MTIKMATEVINIANKNFQSEDVIYIGPSRAGFRKSKYSNPFSTGRNIYQTKEEILKYYDYLTKNEEGMRKLEEMRRELKGKKLGCPCKTTSGRLCHGDVIVYLLDGTLTPTLEELLISNQKIEGELPPVIQKFKHKPKKPVEVAKPKEKMVNYLDLDRVKGAMYGMILGDALGGPHEIGNMDEPEVKVPKYTGEIQFSHVSDDSGLMIPVGGVSDLIETTLVLSRSLIEYKEYNHQNVIESLIQWEMSNPPMFGPEMKELLVGKDEDPTYESYSKRFEQHFKVPLNPPFPLGDETPVSKEAEETQYHSALIRSFPLACLSGPEGADSLDVQAIHQDVWGTNPSTFFYICEYIYLVSLKMAMSGQPANIIWDYIKSLPMPDKLTQMFKDIESENYWNEMEIEDKCWIGLSLYIPMVCLYFRSQNYEQSIEELIDWVNTRVRDTDADSAFAGALLGALDGYTLIMKSERNQRNFDLIRKGQRKYKPLRPKQYRLDDLDEVIIQLHQLGEGKE